MCRTITIATTVTIRTNKLVIAITIAVTVTIRTNEAVITVTVTNTVIVTVMIVVKRNSNRYYCYSNYYCDSNSNSKQLLRKNEKVIAVY